MRYQFTILFWMFFLSYTFLALIGADGRPLEFLLGVLTFAMLDELHDKRGDKNDRVLVKDIRNTRKKESGEFQSG